MDLHISTIPLLQRGLCRDCPSLPKPLLPKEGTGEFVLGPVLNGEMENWSPERPNIEQSFCATARIISKDLCLYHARGAAPLAGKPWPKEQLTLSPGRPRRERLVWAAVEELNLSYYIGETLFFTIYTHYGNLI